MPRSVTVSVAIALAVIMGAVGFGSGLVAGARTQLGTAALALGAEAPPEIDLSPVWRAWRIIDERFVPASVATSTVPSTDPGRDRMFGLIAGLAESLDDPYTYFLPPAESKQFGDDMSGAFEGVGMEIAIRDEILTVVSPLKGSPAERAGIRAKDRVLKIDGTDTKGLDITTAVSRIRGEKGSTVKLTIAREGERELLEISVVRNVINVSIISHERRKDGVYVIELASFTANSPALFKDALRSFIDSGSRKLIIDVRGNPGGYLDAAVDMASWFLPAGDVVVTEDYAGHQENVVHRSRGYDVFDESLELVILLNKGSASASEIFALALKGHDKATLIGSTTFGKGSVQELIEITSDTSLKLTVARWIGPNGEPIPNSGIVPDVEVEVSDEDREAGKDPQLEAAVRHLLK
jgi:carboxyl-terminal processing protease